MKKLTKEKLTDKYIISIKRIKVRPAKWEEVHGYGGVRNLADGEPIEEYVYEGEYEIQDRKVIDLLSALLK